MECGTIGASPAAQPERISGGVVELRQYSFLPGKRDALVNLFERVFIAEQEAAGMEVIDRLRDLDDPNRFVWLRGFPDMPLCLRAHANEDFYTGAVWQRKREAASATLVDTDSVLLRPAGPGFDYSTTGERPQVGATEIPRCVVVATIHPLDPVTGEDFPAFFSGAVAPKLTQAGATILAAYASEQGPNFYARLGMRPATGMMVRNYGRHSDA
jgi:hypothetical protein